MSDEHITGAEQYFRDRLTDPSYRHAFETARERLPEIMELAEENARLRDERDQYREIAVAARRFLRAESALHILRKRGLPDRDQDTWHMATWGMLMQLVDRWEGREPFTPLSDEELERILAERDEDHDG